MTFHPNTTPIFVAPGVWGGTNTYRTNPLAMINDMGYRHTSRRLFQTNILFKYDFSRYVKNLEVGVRGSFDNFYSVDKGYSKTYAVQEALSFNESDRTYNLSAPYGINSPLTAFGPSNNAEQRNNAIDVFATHRFECGLHRLSSMVLYHQDSYNSGIASGTPARSINIGAKVSYMFKNRYLLDLAASYGATEKFKKGNRFGLFPAASAAWLISHVPVLKEHSTLTFMILSASTGLVGNREVGGTPY